MKKIHLFIKKNIWKATTFVLGGIVIILLTKTADSILSSNEPVIVKEFTDTLKVIHNYDFLSSSDNDSLDFLLQKKKNQISQLNIYEKELNEYFDRVKKKEDVFDVPNKILISSLQKFGKKGYVQRSSTAYFYSVGPKFVENNSLIDLKIKFFSDELIDEILYVRLTIYKKRNDKYSEYVFDEIYEPRKGINLIRIGNNLSKGDYEFQYGFVLKKDIDNDYPEFYLSKHYYAII
jgi:hypothetical protein